MEAKDLKEAVAKLNESKLLDKKLVLPKKDFVQAFMTAAEAADGAADKADVTLPDEVVKAYDLCKAEKKAAQEEATPVAPASGKKATKAAAKEKGAGREKEYGSVVGSSAHFIMKAIVDKGKMGLAKGGLDTLAKNLEKKFPDTKNAMGRIKNHVGWAVAHKFLTRKEDGTVVYAK